MVAFDIIAYEDIDILAKHEVTAGVHGKLGRREITICSEEKNKEEPLLIKKGPWINVLV